MNSLKHVRTKDVILQSPWEVFCGETPSVYLISSHSQYFVPRCHIFHNMCAGGVLSERKVLETILDSQCGRLARGVWIRLPKLPWEIGQCFFSGAVGTWCYEIITLSKSWDEAKKMDCVCFVYFKRGSRVFVSFKLFILTFHRQECKSLNSFRLWDVACLAQ